MPLGRHRQPPKSQRAAPSARAATEVASQGGRTESPRPRRKRAVADEGRSSHSVLCPGCSTRFELFSAVWCPCTVEHPSKVCPGCGQCLCARPDYAHPWLWVRAPMAFVRHGFSRLFVAYL